jgi:endoglucanase
MERASRDYAQQRGSRTERCRSKIPPLCAVALAITLPVLTVSCVSIFSAYPDSRRSGRPALYTYTKVRTVRKPVNIRSGVNLGVALKGLNGSAWGIELESYDFDMLKSAGFRYIRVPVCFLPYLSEKGDTYRLDEDCLERLDAVLNGILDRGMIAILDFHYLLPEEQYSFDSRAASQRNEREFLAVWDIVARRYAGYPGELYFELANEPREPILPEDWNTYVRKALAIIRSSGGHNDTRGVVVGVNVLIGHVTRSWDNTSGIRYLQVPDPQDDPNIMVTFHYYDPLPFTYQGQTYNETLKRYSGYWLGNRWDNTERQKALIWKDFDVISRWARENGRQVILGEFGVSVHADIESQINWTRFVREEAESRGMIWLFWQFFYEYGGDTLGGLYNKTAGFWRSEILGALQPGDLEARSAVEPESPGPRDEDAIRAAQGLMTALRDPEWTVRRNAAETLAGMAPEVELAVPVLTELLEDEEWQVRNSAARALAAAGPASRPAVPVLIEALGDEEWQIRKSAAAALAAIRPAPRAALPGLTHALQDAEWQVRETAALALARQGSAAEPALSELVNLLGDAEWRVRRIAVVALSVVAPVSQDAVEALRSCLGDPEEEVSEATAAVLRDLGVPAGL